jgi:hypothetical protein
VLRLAEDRGSAPAEFVMVAGLLTVVTLSVLQLGLALHVRNTVQDAAGDGARVAALAGATPEDGAARARSLIAIALGPGYPVEVRTGTTTASGVPESEIRLTAPLPVLGLIGFPRTLEVTGHAVLEDPAE